MECRQHGFLLQSFAIRPRMPMLLANPLFGIQYPHRAEECNLLLVNQHWYVHLSESIGERRSRVCTCFTISDHTTGFFEILLYGVVQNSAQHACILTMQLCLRAFHQSPSGATLQQYRYGFSLEEFPFYLNKIIDFKSSQSNCMPLIKVSFSQKTPITRQHI